MIEKLIEDDGRFLDEDGITWEDRSSYLQIEILGLCGCGNPDAVMKYIYDILKRCTKWAEEDYSNTAVAFLLYWADNKGFTEHGTSIYGSWLLPKGEELLKDIEWCLEN